MNTVHDDVGSAILGCCRLIFHEFQMSSMGLIHDEDPVVSVHRLRDAGNVAADPIVIRAGEHHSPGFRMLPHQPIDLICRGNTCNTISCFLFRVGIYRFYIS